MNMKIKTILQLFFVFFFNERLKFCLCCIPTVVQSPADQPLDAGMMALAEKRHRCRDVCQQSDLTDRVTAAQQVTVDEGTASCIQSSTTAKITCSSSDAKAIVEDSSGITTTKNAPGGSLDVACGASGQWLYLGDAFQKITCVTAAPASPGPGLPVATIAKAGTIDNGTDDQESTDIIITFESSEATDLIITLDSSEFIVEVDVADDEPQCIQACSTNPDDLLAIVRPEIRLQVNPKCQGQQQAAEGDKITVFCDVQRTVLFFVGDNKEKNDIFETEARLVCTGKGWTYIDSDLLIEEYITKGTQRRIQCL